MTSARPRRLKRELVGHDVDRNLSHQHNLSVFDIAVMVLAAAGNGIDDLRPLVPRALEVFGAAKAGTVTFVRA